MGAQRKMVYLSKVQLDTVNLAASMSEEVIGNWFQLTISNWKKYRYDIRTLKDLSPKEIAPHAFAQIMRYGRPAPPDGMREGDFYSICLQDHNIVRALKREPALRLLPLLTYVITHELVHIIRFYKFFQFFHADETQRAAEEVLVHDLTHKMLKKIQMPDLPLVFDFYSQHRQMVD